MLVLSRKVGERIVVPEYRLSITIVAIEGSKVRLFMPVERYED